MLKTLAIFGVIVIHTSAYAYVHPPGSFDWLSALSWGVLTRASVPVFFMCSGALLLNPEKKLTIKSIYTKYLPRLLAAMFIWALLYKVFHGLVSDSFSADGLLLWLKELLLFNHEQHLYYLHIALLLYAMLPVLRVFVKNAGKAELQYALCIWLLLGIIYPTCKSFWPLSLLSGIPLQWMLNMTWSALGYALLGYYLKAYPLGQKISALLMSFGLVFIYAITVCLSDIKGSLDTRFLEGMSIGVACLATGVWGIAQHFAQQLKKNAAKFVSYLSQASFCIFLVHMFFVFIFDGIGLGVTSFPCIISVPLLSMLNLVCCCAVYFFLSKIPLVKKWLI